MHKRPLSVTIIAWLLIISSVMSVFTYWSSFNDPVVQQIMAQSPFSPTTQMIFTIANVVLTLIIGVAILKRQNWARYAYVVIGAIGIVIAFISSPVKSVVLISVIFLALVAFFLFRKPANEWFAGAPA